MHRPSMRLQRFFFHPFSRSAGPWKLRSNETAAVSTTSSPAPPVQPAFHHKLVTLSRLSNLSSRIDIELKRFLKNVEKDLTRRKHNIKLCEGLWTSRSVPYSVVERGTTQGANAHSYRPIKKVDPSKRFGSFSRRLFSIFSEVFFIFEYV